MELCIESKSAPLNQELTTFLLTVFGIYEKLCMSIFFVNDVHTKRYSNVNFREKLNRFFFWDNAKLHRTCLTKLKFC